MSKHTPGPWFIDYEGGGAMGRRAMLETKDGQTIGYLYEAEFDDEMLIAAAPELLAALQYMVNVCPAIDDQGEEAHQRARAAIAKATGEKI
jgi:hypothetical protein